MRNSTAGSEVDGRREHDLAMKVLLVDDSPTKALAMRRRLEAHGFAVLLAGDGREALTMARHEKPDAIVSDVLMPNLDGFELCREARADRGLRTVPIVLVTAAFDTRDDREFALKIGADAYFEEQNLDSVELAVTIRNAVVQRRGLLGTPFSRKQFSHDLPREEDFYHGHAERLRTLVANKIDEVERSYSALTVAYDNILDGLITALDLRDMETEVHSWRVAEYSLVIATRAELDWSALTDIERGALLHDIGKIGVSDAILRKPAPLDDSEWKEMRKHPELGYEMLRGIEFLRGAGAIVLAHHERWDGQGYPRGLAKEEIPLGARIFAIADAMDAITSDRPYRSAASFESALEELDLGKGRQFDPALVDLAVRVEPASWRAIREQVELRRFVRKASRGRPS